MPVPENEIMKFFVYVVESPSADDIFNRTNEGTMIQQAVNLNNIPCSVVTAINKVTFKRALHKNLLTAINQCPNMIPILHISLHGDEHGICLSSGEVLSWEEFRLLLAPINMHLNNRLLVCLSCCEGYAGSRMAMFLEDNINPFYALIANSLKPTWSDTAVAYSTLYHQLAKGEYLEHAVNAMKTASCNNYFILETADKSKQTFINYLNNHQPSDTDKTPEQEEIK